MRPGMRSAGPVDDGGNLSEEKQHAGVDAGRETERSGEDDFAQDAAYLAGPAALLPPTRVGN